LIGRVWISAKSTAKQKQAAGKVLKKSSYKEEEGKSRSLNLPKHFGK